MKKQKDYLIIYHKEDNDGLFSAAIFYDYLTRVMEYKLEDLCFIGADYNDLVKFQKENNVKDLHNDFKHIIMTDISFNDPKYMKALWDEFGHDFSWCDHHAPIIKESYKIKFDDIPGVRDTGRSAILCAYKYLYDQFDEAYNKKQVPELLRILSGWDSWSYEKEGYEFEYVRRINKAVTYKYGLDLGKIRQLIYDLILTYQYEPTGIFYGYDKDANLISDLYSVGSIIADVKDEDKGRPLYKKACAIFMQGPTSSTMFKCLKKTDIDQGIVFKHKSDGNWVVSLYNINEDNWVHCGEYLKEKYGGGGHKGAAGCTISQEQFINILKDKIL